MINTVDTPKLIHPVVILEIEPKMIDIDDINTIRDQIEDEE